MAALTAWIAANWFGLTIAIVGAIWAYINKDAIKAKFGRAKRTKKVADMAEDGTALEALLRKLADALQHLFERLGMKGDAAKRTIHQFFLICIEDDIQALPDGPAKTEQLNAIEVLAKGRALSAANPKPTSKTRKR